MVALLSINSMMAIFSTKAIPTMNSVRAKFLILNVFFSPVVTRFGKEALFRSSTPRWRKRAIGRSICKTGYSIKGHCRYHFLGWRSYMDGISATWLLLKATGLTETFSFIFQEYVLVCCQHSGGGLVDKPGKNRDYYHTCYCLSGLSVAQNNISRSNFLGEWRREMMSWSLTRPRWRFASDAMS